MAVVFIFSASLQLNDPDPALWFAVYAIAAMLAAISGLSRHPLVKPATLCLSLLLVMWSLIILLAFEGKINWEMVFQSFAMTDNSVEIIREIGGLWFISLWALYTSVYNSILAKHQVHSKE